MRERAASNTNDRNCCLLINFYLHLISPQFNPPSLYNALAPRCHLSLADPLYGQPLALFTLPFCCHSCLLGGRVGEWYVWSPEDTESGLQWHVSPGRVSDPRGGVKIAQAKTASEGRRQRLRYWGWGVGGNPVYTNPRSLCWLKQLLLVFVSSQDLPQLP